MHASAAAPGSLWRLRGSAFECTQWYHLAGGRFVPLSTPISYTLCRAIPNALRHAVPNALCRTSVDTSSRAIPSTVGTMSCPTMCPTLCVSWVASHD
eukprot:349777-Chlamydomonas_euryale.AAC.8